MNDTSNEQDDAPNVDTGGLRFLRILVTVLTTVMICGVVVVVGLLVTRLSNNDPILPDDIELPDGATAQAVTMGDTWFAVVTDDQRILIFDRTSGRLRQSITLDQNSQ